jgi:hypothetical protein
MALTSKEVASLEKKEADAIKASSKVQKIDFSDTLEETSQSDPLSGLVTARGKTKGGNYRYRLTAKEGFMTFYSSEEITDRVISDHVFSYWVRKDDPNGKGLWFY